MSIFECCHSETPESGPYRTFKLNTHTGFRFRCTEVKYFNDLDTRRRKYLSAELFAAKPPAIIIAEPNTPEEIFLCDRENIPSSVLRALQQELLKT